MRDTDMATHLRPCTHVALRLGVLVIEEFFCAARSCLAAKRERCRAAHGEIFRWRLCGGVFSVALLSRLFRVAVEKYPWFMTFVF
jgi:hypothetical protein